jgi:hypothetical protein
MSTTFKKKLIELSSSDNYEECLLEWKIVKFCHLNGQPLDNGEQRTEWCRCLCRHRIKYYYFMYNILLKKYIRIGRMCISQFPEYVNLQQTKTSAISNPYPKSTIKGLTPEEESQKIRLILLQQLIIKIKLTILLNIWKKNTNKNKKRRLQEQKKLEQRRQLILAREEERKAYEEYVYYYEYITREYYEKQYYEKERNLKQLILAREEERKAYKEYVYYYEYITREYYEKQYYEKERNLKQLILAREEERKAYEEYVYYYEYITREYYKEQYKEQYNKQEQEQEEHYKKIKEMTQIKKEYERLNKKENITLYLVYTRYPHLLSPSDINNIYYTENTIKIMENDIFKKQGELISTICQELAMCDTYEV